MAEKQRRNFTVAFVNSLRSPPTGKRLEVRDARVLGWALRITPKGVRTFSFTYRRGGVHRRMTLGRWPVDHDAQADALAAIRRRALELQARVAAGADPVGEERAAAARRPPQQTVAWLSEQYIKREARPAIKTWRAAERLLANHWLPAIGDVPIHEVGHQQLYDVIDRLVAEGKRGAAGEARKVITRLFNWALERGYLQHKPGPLRHRALDAKNREPRARALNDDELAAVWLAAPQLGTPWAQAVRALLLTGARRSEVFEARWSEVAKEGDGRWLEVPAARYKTGRDHNIPLVAAAWAELQGLPRFLCANPYIFSVRGGVAPVRGIGRPKKRLDEAAAAVLGRPLAPWRLHDLRVTCRTRLTQLGVPRDVAEAVIGHAKQGVEAIYNKHEYRAERRDALESYAAYVLQLASEENSFVQEG